VRDSGRKLDQGRVERLRARVDKQQERIDELKQKLRSERPRNDLSYVFICTYGRSGSTLLQGVLNSIPGYLIRGENRQALWHLYQLHQTVMQQKRIFSGWMNRGEPLPVSHPFFGLDGYPDSAHREFRRLAQNLLLRPKEDTRVTGFKEIRWAEDDVLGYVQFLRNVFPDARFVINTRNLDDVTQSAWWGEDPDARAVLERAEARLADIERELAGSAYRVRYDDYVADPSVLRGLFDWLGEDFDLDAVRAVLEVEHSYQPKDDDED
jgi:hypothetical protein